MAAPKDVVIFDLDRTLTLRPTFTSFLFFICHAHPAKYLAVPVLIVHLLAYVLGMANRTRTKERMLSAIAAGITRGEIDHLAKAFVSRRLRHGLRPGAKACIADHKAKGRRVIVATAAMDFIVEHFVAGLKLDGAIASVSAWDKKNRLMPKLVGGNNYGSEKAKRVQGWLAKTKVGKVWFYSDSHVDLPTFNLVDFKIVVSPTPKLQKLAKEQGFEIANWG